MKPISFIKPDPQRCRQAGKPTLRRGLSAPIVAGAIVAVLAVLAAAYYFLVRVPAVNRAEQSAIEKLRQRNVLVMVMPGGTHAQTANLMSEPVDESLMFLMGDLVYLEQLILNDTSLGDQHVPPLAKLTRLNSLSLGRNQLTSASLQHIAGLTGLESLALRGNPNLGDAGLDALGGLKKLKVLDLALCGISDAGLKHLTGLTELQHLVLSDNPITDEGITEIAKLPALLRISLGGTKITPAGIRALTDARPGINVEMQSLVESPPAEEPAEGEAASTPDGA